MSHRYDSKLGDSEKAAIRQGTRNALLTGSLFGVIFCMYGFGFWYGSTMIAKSIDSAIEAHPAPADLLDPNGVWYPIITMGCQKYLVDNPTPDEMEVLEVCACGLPWELLGNITAPNCGCGYEQAADSDLGLSVLAGCVSGGRVMMVFFSILVGGFSAGQIGPGVKAIADARAAAAKMLAVMERVPTIGGDDDGDGDGGDHDNKHAGDGGKPKKKKKRLKREEVRGDIVLENVHFQYQRLDLHLPDAPDDKKDKKKSGKDGEDTSLEGDHDQHVSSVVFAGCNLTIKAGETVALVGESGCGKSTIAKMVQRFYDPTDGRVLLDGTDLKDINVRDLRSCIGVVSQEPLLFDTTIEANIRFGKPDATFEEIVAAAESANAHDFIMSFPEGYQTNVGARGGRKMNGFSSKNLVGGSILSSHPISPQCISSSFRSSGKLSGGQKQR